MVEKTDRVMVFIDGSKLYHSLKSYFRRTDLDIARFCDKILDRRASSESIITMPRWD